MVNLARGVHLLSAKHTLSTIWPRSILLRTHGQKALHIGQMIQTGDNIRLIWSDLFGVRNEYNRTLASPKRKPPATSDRQPPSQETSILLT